MRDEQPLVTKATMIVGFLLVVTAATAPPAWLPAQLPGWSPTLSALVGIGLLLFVISDHVWTIVVQLHYLRQELRDRREA